MKLDTPTSDRILWVACNVRQEDHNEAMLSHGIPGYEAVMLSTYQSDECRAILGDDGEVIGITGLVRDQIWMMGTSELTASRSHRRQLVTLGREWVEHCLEITSPIGNDVLASNTRSIRWLKALGFEMEQPRPWGPCCALFCRFWRFG